MKPAAWIPTLYFTEGLPYIAVNTLSVVLYTDMGVPNGRMAFYTSLLYLPWVLKCLWSPLVDVLRTKRWWILTMQWLMAALLAAVALSIPASWYFIATLLLFWVTAFASATHDVAADGFYMLALDSNKQSMYVGIRSTFYRLATVFGNGVLVSLAGVLETHTGSVAQSWKWVMLVAAAIICLCALWHSYALPRPEGAIANVRRSQPANLVVREIADSFTTFFAKKGILLTIIFLLLYRLPEALILKLVYPFLLGSPETGALGMSKEFVGMVYGGLGVGGLLAGGIVGGLVAARKGLRYWLKPMAWAMSLTCLGFILLALVPNPSHWLVAACIVVEQIGYGFGFSAYMLYMLYVSQGRFATSHYAICTAFMAASMMLPGMVAGWLEEMLGYLNFFILCIACCAATIGVCYIVNVDPQFGKKQ